MRMERTRRFAPEVLQAVAEVRMERTRRFAPEVLQAVAEVREAQTPRQQRQRDEAARIAAADVQNVRGERVSA